MDEEHDGRSVAFWKNVVRLDFTDCMHWTTNYLSYGPKVTKAQRKAALKRIENLRASLDGLEIALKKQERVDE